MALVVAVAVTTGPVQHTLGTVMTCLVIAAVLTVATEAAGDRAQRTVLATSAVRRRTHRSMH